jgi:hypothetical protein
MSIFIFLYYFLKFLYERYIRFIIQDSCEKAFLCADESKCIPYRLTSDRYSDCKDSSDEKLCNEYIQTCVDFSGEYLAVGKYFTRE